VVWFVIQGRRHSADFDKQHKFFDEKLRHGFRALPLSARIA
jgi:hypothetical protein